MRLPIAQQGWSFILPLLGAAVALSLVTGPVGGGAALVLAAFVTYFFRDPERTIPVESGVFLAPADGKVVGIAPQTKGPGGTTGTLVSTFLSLFDVHINRAPVSGLVVDVRHQPGKFLPAFRPEASASNEQNILVLRAGPAQVVIKQIAGILARRIVCWAKPGDMLRAGERFGLIRFGSRVDVFIPHEYAVQVCLGERVRGGETVLAEKTVLRRVGC